MPGSIANVVHFIDNCLNNCLASVEQDSQGLFRFMPLGNCLFCIESQVLFSSPPLASNNAFAYPKEIVMINWIFYLCKLIST